MPMYTGRLQASTNAPPPLPPHTCLPKLLVGTWLICCLLHLNFSLEAHFVTTTYVRRSIDFFPSFTLDKLPMNENVMTQ